jgi:hypothetical protein
MAKSIQQNAPGAATRAPIVPFNQYARILRELTHNPVSDAQRAKLTYVNGYEVRPHWRRRRRGRKAAR